MNEIGRLLGIPAGGWKHGQSKLFEGGDIRLRWLLQRLAMRSVSERIAQNLARAVQIGNPGDLMLTVVTAARENHASLADVSMRSIDTFQQGGLDFLWVERKRLGLPKSITDAWRGQRERINPETGHSVFPALIPARDQVVAYAAQIRSSFEHSFRKHLAKILAEKATAALSRMGRLASLVWKAYSFLAPGGAAYDSKKTVAAQSGQPFGARSALLFLAHRMAVQGVVELDQILTTPDLNSVEWVRSAKTRVAETLFLERLWTVSRDLLPPAEF